MESFTFPNPSLLQKTNAIFFVDSENQVTDFQNQMLAFQNQIFDFETPTLDYSYKNKQQL